MRHTFRYTVLCWLPLLVALGACQSTPAEPGMKLGKPYIVDGRTYYPEYDPTYDKIGQASWYGPGFHGKYTASGEVYNQNGLTAAHPTLPMPSLVRVTNLSTGKSLIVRINDRGPFKSNRIIDLSKRAAQELGIRSTAEVRVQYLKQETQQYIASLSSSGSKQANDMLAYNAAAENAKNASILRSTEPSGQIVESTVANSHAGQTVNEAAPVLTVSEAELNTTNDSSKNELPPVETLYKKETPPQPSKGLIKQAMADENTAADLPPATDATKEVILDIKKPVQVNDTVPPQGKKLDQKESKKSSSVTATAPKSNAWYIQAGSFATEENARKLSSRLSDVSKVDVAKVEMGDKIWWRVRLGPFHQQQEAQDVLAKVRTANAPDARIVHQ